MTQYLHEGAQRTAKNVSFYNTVCSDHWAHSWRHCCSRSCPLQAVTATSTSLLFIWVGRDPWTSAEKRLGGGGGVLLIWMENRSVHWMIFSCCFLSVLSIDPTVLFLLQLVTARHRCPLACAQTENMPFGLCPDRKHALWLVPWQKTCPLACALTENMPFGLCPDRKQSAVCECLGLWHNQPWRHQKGWLELMLHNQPWRHQKGWLELMLHNQPWRHQKGWLELMLHNQPWRHQKGWLELMLGDEVDNGLTCFMSTSEKRLLLVIFVVLIAVNLQQTCYRITLYHCLSGVVSNRLNKHAVRSFCSSI